MFELSETIFLLVLQKEADRAAEDAAEIKKRFLAVQGQANDAQHVAMETKREAERLREAVRDAGGVGGIVASGAVSGNSGPRLAVRPSARLRVAAAQRRTSPGIHAGVERGCVDVSSRAR